MKVCYIGPYCESTGWGEASRNILLSLKQTSIDLQCKLYRLSSPIYSKSDEIVELESKYETPDVVIQNVLPHHMTADHRYHNIGLFFYEFKGIKNTPWYPKLMMMDELWVTNTLMLDELSEHKNVKWFPCPININKGTEQSFHIPQLSDKFVFYTVCEYQQRKNLPALIKAFHTEFGREERVALLLKVHKFGLSPQKTFELINHECQTIKKNLKLYKDIDDYHHDIVVADNMNNSSMHAHYTGNCFVMPSYGEAVCLPAYDALNVGNDVIITKNNDGHINKIAKLIDGTWEPVCGMMETFAELGTGREQWFSVDINSLRKNMRLSYCEGINVKAQLQRKKWVKAHSIINTADKLQGLLKV